MTIHNDCQVTPLAADFQVRDVSDPNLIGASRLPIEGAIRDRAVEDPIAWRGAVDPGRAGFQLRRPHQPGYTFPADAHAGLRQLGVDSRRPVSAFTGYKDRSYPSTDTHVFTVPLTGGAAKPGVVARPADAVAGAECLYAVSVLRRLDERKNRGL